jgi:hypothetical protein
MLEEYAETLRNHVSDVVLDSDDPTAKQEFFGYLSTLSNSTYI